MSLFEVALANSQKFLLKALKQKSGCILTPITTLVSSFLERERPDTTLCECEGSDAKSTCETCGAIALLDEGGESIRILVKEKSSIVVHLKII
jgi:hypothetical protein